jgi:hypothetical protein
MSLFATCIHTGFFLGLDPEDGGDIFLRNLLTLNGLRCVTSQKIELFITTAVITLIKRCVWKQQRECSYISMGMMSNHKSDFTTFPPPQFQELCVSLFRLYLSLSPSVPLPLQIFLAVYFVLVSGNLLRNAGSIPSLEVLLQFLFIFLFHFCSMRKFQILPLHLTVIRYSYPCNRPWRPIRLWDVEVPTFSRQSTHRWRWGCQPYASTALYPQEDSWH